MRTYRPTRSIALRYRIAIAVTLLLAALLAAQSVHADGSVSNEPAPLSRLVKFEDRQYEIAYAPSVSLDPVSSATVSKVGYGHATTVNIVTTTTGTYSTDGLTSSNVLYPGINVRRVIEEPEHWPHPGTPGSSFSIRSVGYSPSGALVINRINDLGVRSCVMRNSITTCYRTY